MSWGAPTFSDLVMTPARDVGTKPPFEGGTLSEDGCPVGFWFLDRLDLVLAGDARSLAASHPHGSPHGRRPLRMLWRNSMTPGLPTSGYSVLRVVRRQGADLLCHLRVFATSDVPVPGALVPPRRVDVTFEQVVRDIRATGLAVAGRSDLVWALPGTPDAPSVGTPMEAFDAATAAAVPFTSTLDGAAMARVPGRPGPLEGAYAGLDGNLFPGAPVWDAVRRRPDLDWLLGAAWRRDRDAFVADLALGGPEAVAGRQARLAYGMGGAALASLSLASASLHKDRADGNVRWRTSPRLADGDGLARTMSVLPPNWLPRDEASCEDFLDCAPLVAMAARWSADPAQVARLAASKGRWDRWSATLARPGGIPRTTGATALQAHDVVRAFARQVLQPAAVLSGGADVAPCPMAEHVAARLLFSGRNLRGILEVVDRWHAGQAVVAARLRALPGRRASPSSWPLALPAFAVGDLSVVPIGDGLGLAEEGAEARDREGVPGLSHCVGAYDRSCLDGTSRIASIRRSRPDGGYERLSTVEFVRTEGTLGVRQHRGLRNAPPPAEAEGLLSAYLGGFADGSLRVATREMKPVRGSARMVWSVYDARHAGNWRVAMDAWRDLVPSGLRSCGPDDLLGLMVAVAREASLDPEDVLARHWLPEPFGFGGLTGTVPSPSGMRRGGHAPEWSRLCVRPRPGRFPTGLLHGLVTWLVGSSVGHDPHE